MNTEDLSRVRKSVSTEVLFCVRNQWTLRTYPESNSHGKVYDIHIEVIKTKNSLVIWLIEYCIENPLEIISFAVKSEKIDLHVYAFTLWICDWYTRQTTSVVTLDFGVEASLWRLLHIQSEIGIESVRKYKGTPHPCLGSVTSGENKFKRPPPGSFLPNTHKIVHNDEKPWP